METGRKREEGVERSTFDLQDLVRDEEKIDTNRMAVARMGTRVDKRGKKGGEKEERGIKRGGRREESREGGLVNRLWERGSRESDGVTEIT